MLRQSDKLRWTTSAFPYYWVSHIAIYDTVSINFKQYYYLKGLGSLVNRCFLREDTMSKKIWILKPDSTEAIIYDYTMNIGDSIWLTFFNSDSSTLFQTGTYYLDSVITKEFSGIYRKVFYLSNPFFPLLKFHGFKKPVLTWIEGISSTLSPCYLYEKTSELDTIYSHPPWAKYSPGAYDPALICVEANYIDPALLIYQNPDATDCVWNLGGIEDKVESTNISIYPNPANETVNIVVKGIPYDILKNVKITDCLGKTVMELSFRGDQSWIDAENLTNGIYFITIIYSNVSFTSKFIKL